MNERNESSVIASLSDILRSEQRRTEQEASARSAHEAAMRRAASEAEERARAVVREREAREQAALREEGARLQALQAAEVARAEREADASARLAALRAAQEHERRLAAVQFDARRKASTRTAYATSALLVVTLATSAWYTQHLARLRDAERIAYRQATADETSSNESLRRALREQAGTCAAVQAQLAECSRPETHGPPPPAGRNDTPPAHVPRAPPQTHRTTAAAAAPAPDCRKGDPMCAEIP